MHTGAMPDVHADVTQLRQVLQKLIDSAIEYQSERRSSHVRTPAQLEGDMVHFAVTDNGMGSVPAYVERIFGVSRRLHAREQSVGRA